MFKLFNRKKNSQEEIAEKAKQERERVQDWLPFFDIENGMIRRKDNHIVAALRVEPLNITLKSDKEKRRIISAMHEAINGQREAIQKFCMGRPVDLDAYLQILETKARETVDAKRKKILRDYIRYVAGIATGGEALEQRFYILLTQKIVDRQERQAYDELVKRSYEFIGNMRKAGLEVKGCDDSAIIDLYFTFFHPAQAAFEKPPGYTAAIPMYVSKGD